MFITLQEGGKFAPSVISGVKLRIIFIYPLLLHTFFCRLWKDCFGNLFWSCCVIHYIVVTLQHKMKDYGNDNQFITGTDW